MDLAKLIVFQARAREHEPAIAFTGGVATYGTMAKAVATATDQLDRAGLKRGALVAIDVRNPFQHVVLILALGLKGMVSASVQTSFSVEESGLKPDAILVDGHAKHPPGVRQVAISDDWFVVDPTGKPDFGYLLSLPGFPDENDVIRVIFSSGTTGVPKSTGLSSGNLARRLANASFTHGGGSVGGIRALTLMGFSTIGGYMVAVGALAGGGIACFATNPPEALHIMRMFDVDFLTLAVFQLHAVLAALGDSRAPPALKTLVVGGSKLPLDLLNKARARLCSNISFGYGSTEAGSIAHAPGAFLENLEGAAGYVVPWATLQVVDVDDRPQPPGTEGILRVRTDEQARYVVDTPENAILFRDGWFYPGDVGTIRADGLVFVTGRSSEVINRGGSIVAPDVVERILSAQPGVKEAAAFGVPTQLGIDDIWAAVVVDGPFDELALLKACREKLVDKAPGVIRQVAAIPRAESGKIRRRQLRDEVLAQKPA